MKFLMAVLFVFGSVVAAEAGPGKSAKRGTASLDGQQGTENLSATPGNNVRVECKLVCPSNVGQGTEQNSAQNCSCAPGTIKPASNACPNGQKLSYGPAPYSDADQNFHVWTCK